MEEMEFSKCTRRQFLKGLGISAASLAIGGCITQSQSLSSNKHKEQPNIILIMADDMGYSDIGCYGGEIETPNLNKLAANGLRFTQFYNGARCCPTRASLLTGLYAHQTGIGHMTDDRGLEGYRGDLNNNCVTIAEVLKGAGYRTYMAGKWHVTRHIKAEGPKHNWPCQRGFDKFYGTIIGAGSYFQPTTLVEQNTMIEVTEADYYYTDAISEKAAGYINEHFESEAGRPFFMYVAYTSPHWPLHAFEKDIKKYEGRFDAGWDVLRAERQKRMIKMGLIDERWKLTERDRSQRPWEDVRNKDWQRRRMEVYAAQVDRMDSGIGRIVKELERRGELDNCLIFFLADNGGCAEEIGEGWKNWIISAPVGTSKTHTGKEVIFGNKPEILAGAEDTYQSYGVPWANVSNTPFRLYKHWVHEGGIASPLIVHWPEQIQKGGQLRGQVGHLIDIMPTCVEAAGAKYPKKYQGNKIRGMEGRSLFGAFEGKEIRRDGLFWEHEGNRAVRIGKWKLVARGEQGPWELYDMEADRTETNDLSGRYPEVVEEMSEKYNEWAVRAKVLPNKQPPPKEVLENHKLIEKKIGWEAVEGHWEIQDSLLKQTSRLGGCRIFAPRAGWQDYVYEVKARKTAGAEGFLILFRAKSKGQYYQWNVGGWGNSRHAVQNARNTDSKEGRIESNRWYDIKVEVEGTNIRCYLDNELIHNIEDDKFGTGGIGLGTWATEAEYKDIKVSRPDGKIIYEAKF